MTKPAACDPADALWMERALAEARLGVGLTSPNPPVGAVIVRDGELLGAGHHCRAGGPHAEIEALTQARAAFPDRIRGATIYVTLEPCSTQGRTPPCTGAILAAGITRVVYGASDPNPAHQGRADELLRAGGIAVSAGVLAADCDDLIRPFRKWITTRRPYIIAKAGQTLDGRITRPFGEPQWITSEAARAHGRRLRTRVDAILVGAETVRRVSQSCAPEADAVFLSCSNLYTLDFLDSIASATGKPVLTSNLAAFRSLERLLPAP